MDDVVIRRFFELSAKNRGVFHAEVLKTIATILFGLCRCIDGVLDREVKDGKQNGLAEFFGEQDGAFNGFFE